MSTDAEKDRPPDRVRYEKIGDFASIYQRGQVWWINYQNPDGKQVRKTLKTTSKKQAKLLALRKETELQQGRDSADIKVAGVQEAIDAYDAYLVTEGRKKKTLLKYRKVFERMAQLAVQRQVRDLRGVNLQFVDAFRQQRKEEGAAPKTIHVETTVVRQVINFALSRDMLDADRLKGLKLKRPKPTPQPCWTLAQVESILAALRDDPYYPVYFLVARTGLRIGEAQRLTWNDVDFDNRVLRIRSKEVDGEDETHWTPKTEGQRVVPMSPSLVELLRSLPQKSRWVFPTPSRLRRLAGCPIDERRVLGHLKKALAQLDLPGHTHTFRHSLISHALISGTPEAVVRKWAGHVDEQILKLYTHVADPTSKAYMNRLFPGGVDDSGVDGVLPPVMEPRPAGASPAEDFTHSAPKSESKGDKPISTNPVQRQGGR